MHTHCMSKVDLNFINWDALSKFIKIVPKAEAGEQHKLQIMILFKKKNNND